MGARGRMRWLILGVAAFLGDPRVDTQSLGSSGPSTPQVRPAHGSPLAALPDRVFAVSNDGKQIIARRADLSTGWQVLAAGGSFGRIGGLAVSGTSLFVTDRADEAVYRVDLASGERTTLFREGPLSDPGSVAVARDVFVADDTSGRLYRIRGGTIAEVELDGEAAAGRRLSLAASGDDLLVATPSGSISELRGIGKADPDKAPSPMQQSVPYVRRKGSTDRLVYAIQKRALPEIREPAHLAMWKGVVYVIDASHGSIFGFGRYDQRPVRLVHSSRPRTSVPTSLAVNDRALYVMNGAQLESWPRLVPAEVHLRLASLSEAMTLVYEYLAQRNILAVRAVPVEHNLETTLKKHRVILGGYPRNLSSLLCGINTGLCDKSGKIRAVQPKEAIWVPDLHSENYVDAVLVKLDGKESLGEAADRRVSSPEFAAWTSEARLRELNESAVVRLKSDAARDLRIGEYMVPVEYVRYLVPAIAGDASRDGALKKLEGILEGIKVVSLEERPVSTAEAAGLRSSPGADLEALRVEFEALLKRVDYGAPANNVLTPKVGIAEQFIDQDHPDLQAAIIPGEGVIRAAPAGPAPGGPIDYRIRSFEDADHGTMVAGLIGARATGFKHKGLAPKSMLLSMQSSDPPIGEEIRRAVLRGVFLFNISAHYKINIIPPSLQQAIDNYPRALFVVAAGNDMRIGSTDEICRQASVFPACWHGKRNVIVVTATNATGDAVLPPTAAQNGANWSGTAVHLAAPGEGFHAPAVGRSYAPVRGSSFAAPLVTATAALIYSQGFTDPWPIKQRLIATADPETGLAGKVVGGRLNVRRAVSDPGFGVLSRQVRVDANSVRTEIEKVIIDLGSITVRQADGDDRTIALRKLLRVHRYGTGYRVVFVDGDDVRVLEGASFQSEADAQFRATRENGSSVLISLIQWTDYVGPIPVF